MDMAYYRPPYTYLQQTLLAQNNQIFAFKAYVQQYILDNLSKVHQLYKTLHRMEHLHVTLMLCVYKVILFHYTYYFIPFPVVCRYLRGNCND